MTTNQTNHTGDTGTPEKPVSAHVFAIGPEEVHETTGLTPAEIKALRGTAPVIWVDFDGPVDEETLGEFGKIFELHRLRWRT